MGSDEEPLHPSGLKVLLSGFPKHVFPDLFDVWFVRVIHGALRIHKLQQNTIV